MSDSPTSANAATSIIAPRGATPHAVQSGFEREVLPAWLDKDPAADEPNYLGYILSVMPAATIFVFAGLAFLLYWLH